MSAWTPCRRIWASVSVVAAGKRRRSRPLATQRLALGVLYDRLVELYGKPKPQRALPPLDELVLTILSQNTTDTNRDRAWGQLRQRYPDWQGVAVAPLQHLEDALQPGGLQRVKARRIQETLCRVYEQRGVYDLDHLGEIGLDAARAELSDIKGLGAKSVNCILLFSLRLEAFPVDTHVCRVLHRLDIHRQRDLGRANDELQAAVPAGKAFPLHVNIIRHGRQICHARRPECWRCGIEDLCGYDGKSVEPPASTRR